ncbi:hypothetical protein E2C01_046872 [Portunus trituberculatus]|uniref:Uncharacterized protein n=1 Tax=Portunus trituberculatus TaxID=210409 RepID=A0A5B7G5Z1_PORTR|nr:hypothetical protein [Portunus trituberculatus]
MLLLTWLPPRLSPQRPASTQACGPHSSVKFKMSLREGFQRRERRAAPRSRKEGWTGEHAL